MPNPPIIGITADTDDKHHFLNRVYIDAVVASGAIPLVLPCNDVRFAATFLDCIDGLLLSGGGDMCASHFGQTLDPRAVDVQPIRDGVELNLAQLALDRNMPVLGICRGMQLLNVLRGGDLFQHIEGHRQSEPRNDATHSVTISGRLAALLNTETIKTNTIHHQAVDRVGGNFEVCGRTADGIIEAIWATDKDFVVGVQWHPEELMSYPPHAAIFAAFAAATLEGV